METKEIYIKSKLAKLYSQLAEGLKQKKYLISKATEYGELIELINNEITVSEEEVRERVKEHLDDAVDMFLNECTDANDELYILCNRYVDCNDLTDSEKNEMIAQLAGFDYDFHAEAIRDEKLYDSKFAHIDKIDSMIDNLISIKERLYNDKNEFLKGLIPTAVHSINNRLHFYYEINGYKFHGEYISENDNNNDEAITIDYDPTDVSADIFNEIKQIAADELSMSIQEIEKLIELADDRKEYFAYRRNSFNDNFEGDFDDDNVSDIDIFL